MTDGRKYMNQKTIKFLSWEKTKIYTALLLPAFWMVISFLVGRLYVKLYRPEAVFVTPLIRFELLPIVVFLLFYIFQSMLYYPFACSIVTVLDCYKSRDFSSFRKDKSRLLKVFFWDFLYSIL